MNQKDLNVIKIIKQQRQREFEATGKTTKEWAKVFDENLRFEYCRMFAGYVHGNKKIYLDEKSGRFYADIDMKDELNVVEG